MTIFICSKSKISHAIFSLAIFAFTGFFRSQGYLRGWGGAGRKFWEKETVLAFANVSLTGGI